jgi:hypothetical protein
LAIDSLIFEKLALWKREEAKELLQFGINSNTKNQLAFTYANNIMRRLEKNTNSST